MSPGVPAFPFVSSCTPSDAPSCPLVSFCVLLVPRMRDPSVIRLRWPRGVRMHKCTDRPNGRPSPSAGLESHPPSAPNAAARHARRCGAHALFATAGWHGDRRCWGDGGSWHSEASVERIERLPSSYVLTLTSNLRRPAGGELRPALTTLSAGISRNSLGIADAFELISRLCRLRVRFGSGREG